MRLKAIKASISPRFCEFVIEDNCLITVALQALGVVLLQLLPRFDAYEGKDFVVWGQEEQLKEGDLEQGDWSSCWSTNGIGYIAVRSFRFESSQHCSPKNCIVFAHLTSMTGQVRFAYT